MSLIFFIETCDQVDLAGRENVTFESETVSIVKNK